MGFLIEANGRVCECGESELFRQQAWGVECGVCGATPARDKPAVRDPQPVQVDHNVDHGEPLGSPENMIAMDDENDSLWINTPGGLIHVHIAFEGRESITVWRAHDKMVDSRGDPLTYRKKTLNGNMKVTTLELKGGRF